MVRSGGGFLQGGVGGDHFSGNQVLPDAEMLERALGLSAPQLVCRHFNHTEAIALFSHVDHMISPGFNLDLQADWPPLSDLKTEIAAFRASINWGNNPRRVDDVSAKHVLPWIALRSMFSFKRLKRAALWLLAV
jgi:hypothetical protein